jgi:tRNA(fMet)-specific endonuclease VapC
MNAVLLDTSVASLLHPKKKRAEDRAKYEPHMRGQVLALSFQSVAELWAWAEENNWGEKQKEGMDAFLRRFLVVPYDIELAKIWARISTHCKRIGRRLESGDAWITATAVHHELTLLSHDRDHLDLNIPGLSVISYLNGGSTPQLQSK